MTRRVEEQFEQIPWQIVKGKGGTGGGRSGQSKETPFQLPGDRIQPFLNSKLKTGVSIAKLQGIM